METFGDVHEFLQHKLEQFHEQGKRIRSANDSNAGTLKEELIELPHQFFAITDPTKTVFNLDTYKTQPWWMVGEILSEFLNLNPPLMTRYRPDLIDNSYKLTAQGTVEYMYGNRWAEHNQIENVRKKLAANPTSKRAIIQTWMGYDSDPGRVDVPCNVNYMFLGRDGKLDMTATIRSNDILRGAKYDYALAAFMQQSMASWVGMDVGSLYLSINSLHMYSKDFPQLEEILEEFSMGANPPVALQLLKNVSPQAYWNDMRHVKKAEDASYNGAFDYFEKHVGDMSIDLFKDFAYIYGIRNARTAGRRDLIEKYKGSISQPDIKRWT